ncbi:UNVERIFIED_CONTAM: hypothetical protein K2H54_047058 [Gekko kuhli]
MMEDNYHANLLDAAMDKQDIATLLERMERRLSDKITQSTQPIKEQLQEIQSALKITSQMAEMALKASNAVRTELQGLQSSSTVKIVRAFRLGSPLNPRKRVPRDILIQLADWDSRQLILNLARNKGYLPLNELKILVFPDTPQEALAIRYKLKSVTAKLQMANIRYKWLPKGKLQVSQHGKSYLALDEETGLQLLQALRISEEADPRRSNKRKLQFMITPEKTNKLSIRSSPLPEPEDIADVTPMVN